MLSSRCQLLERGVQTEQPEQPSSRRNSKIVCCVGDELISLLAGELAPKRAKLKFRQGSNGKFLKLCLAESDLQVTESQYFKIVLKKKKKN